MEGSIDERINQGITHAKKEDGWLHVFTQLDRKNKNENFFVRFNSMEWISLSKTNIFGLRIPCLHPMKCEIKRHLIVRVEKDESNHHEVIRSPAYHKGRNDYNWNPPIAKNKMQKKTNGISTSKKKYVT